MLNFCDFIQVYVFTTNHHLNESKLPYFIVVAVDATHRPVKFFHLHAGIASYFHHGGQQYQNFGLQPMKWKRRHSLTNICFTRKTSLALDKMSTFSNRSYS